ncbi:uncharacterized protein LOC119176365 isoform X8 [Rhipicephalus microplus]
MPAQENVASVLVIITTGANLQGLKTLLCSPPERGNAACGNVLKCGDGWLHDELKCGQQARPSAGRRWRRANNMRSGVAFNSGPVYTCMGAA